jgi:NifU-like protein involved in Fe-S cluster formation
MNNQPKIQQKDGSSWLYSDIVKDHFFNPRNILKHDEEADFKYDGVGRVGSPACGDEMIMWIKVDKDTQKITDCRWQTFGCGSAIASTSMLSEMVLEGKGMNIEEALKIKPLDIIERLGGLPKNKIHCSVLGDQALTKAIKDYKSK